MRGTLLGHVINAQAGDIVHDLITPLTLIGSQFGIREIGAHKRHPSANVVVIDFGRNQFHLWVGQYQTNTIALPHHILFRKPREIDVSLDDGIHGNGHLALAHGQRHIIVVVQKLPLEPHIVMMSDDFVQMIFGRVQPGTLSDLHHHQRNGVPFGLLDSLSLTVMTCSQQQDKYNG